MFFCVDKYWHLMSHLQYFDISTIFTKRAGFVMYIGDSGFRKFEQKYSRVFREGGGTERFSPALFR